MSNQRLLKVLGVGAVGAGAYYLYTAGGDPKKATRHFEDDASRATSKIRGSGKSAQSIGEEAGAKVDEAQIANTTLSKVDNARDKARRTDQTLAEKAKEGIDKVDKAGHETARDINAKLEGVDKTLEQKAAEAKSGVSSWFGGKK
ncbi:hypothetical protein FQN57_001425 [Myotisia sp. PD_48]|nr:hypothetical protein FQN57_001425 [Myotisia sp. PD_48]